MGGIHREVLCPYCRRKAVLMDSIKIYKTKSYGMIWVCEPCQAWVGVHRNSPTYAPLGRLADAKLRGMKCKAHAALDYWWKQRRYPRTGVYAALATCMGMSVEQCHIGYFNVTACTKVIQVCDYWREVGQITSEVDYEKVNG